MGFKTEFSDIKGIEITKKNGGSTIVVDNEEFPISNLANQLSKNNVIKHVYISDINGSDSNDGLTSSTPVKTFTRVWELLPYNVTNPFIVHIGKHSGSGYTYTTPPEDRIFAVNAFIVLYGDGAGQAGDDGFIELSTGAAGASTTSGQVELASSATADIFRHRTIEFTTGTATGVRRTIRNNTTTLAIPVQPFDNDIGELAPAAGDTYRILAPAITIIPSFVEYTNGARCNLAAGNTPIHFINMAIEPGIPVGTTTAILDFPYKSWSYGLSINTNLWYIDTGSSLLYTGVDTTLFEQGDGQGGQAVLDTLNIPGRIPGTWHGWGLSFPDTTFVYSLSLFARNSAGYFYGFCTGSMCIPGNGTILGGSFYVISGSIGSVLEIRTWTTSQSFGYGCIPILIRNSSFFSGIYLEEGQTCYVNFVFGSINTSIVIESTSTSSNATAIYSAGSFYSGARINISHTGAGTASLIRVLSGMCTFSDGVTATSTNARGLQIDGGTCALGASTFTCATGILNNSGMLRILGATTFTSTTTGLTQLAGETLLQANCTFIGSDSTGLVQIEGGILKQSSGVLTVTNSGAGSGIKTRDGGVSSLRGGSNNVTSATGAAYDARFGGRIYFTAAPNANAGAGGDFIVQTSDGVKTFSVSLTTAETGYASPSNNGSLVARTA